MQCDLYIQRVVHLNVPLLAFLHLINSNAFLQCYLLIQCAIHLFFLLIFAICFFVSLICLLLCAVVQSLMQVHFSYLILLDFCVFDRLVPGAQQELRCRPGLNLYSTHEHQCWKYSKSLALTSLSFSILQPRVVWETLLVCFSIHAGVLHKPTVFTNK